VLEDILVPPDLVTVHHLRRLELEVNTVRHAECAALLPIVRLQMIIGRVHQSKKATYLVTQHNTGRPNDDSDERLICRCTSFHLRRILYRHHVEFGIRLGDVVRALHRDDGCARVGPMHGRELFTRDRADLLMSLDVLPSAS